MGLRGRLLVYLQAGPIQAPLILAGPLFYVSAGVPADNRAQCEPHHESFGAL
jgi:hypothetical protein